MSEDPEDQLKEIKEYVSTMISSGYDALELEVIQKKFKKYNCVQLLTKLGCQVIDDLVLLRMEYEFDSDEETLY